jgi:hypothetical protein
MGKTLLANLAKVALSNAGPRMTPWAVTATIAKRSAAPRNAVARGIGLVLGIKPNSAEMSMVSPDFPPDFP